MTAGRASLRPVGASARLVLSAGAPRRWQDLRTFRTPTGFRGRGLLTVAAWRVTQASLFAWSPQPCYGWRRFLLRSFGATVGDGALVRPSARIAFPWKLALGAHCWIGDEAVLYNLDHIYIGDHAVVSQRSWLCTAGHAIDRRDFCYRTAPVIIGHEAWIAMGCYVAPGVIIGDGAVLGARSSAFKDVPSGMVASGHPARLRRRRPAEGDANG